MNRDKFMELVYETFADEPDNVLANRIIEAAEAYVEHEKAQLFSEGATSDLISRKQAIDAANDWYEGLICGSVNGLIKRLNALPTVQPEPPWIPVSERLPEEYGEYLVTKRTIGWNCEEYDVNDIAYFDDDGFHKADRIIAWMPLPEPYKPKQKTKW